MISSFVSSSFWEQRLNDQAEQYRAENAQLKIEYEEQIRSLHEQLGALRSENDEVHQVMLHNRSFRSIQRDFL